MIHIIKKHRTLFRPRGHPGDCGCHHCLGADVYRQDVMNAINLMMLQGKLDYRAHYKFRNDYPDKPGIEKVVIYFLDGNGHPIAAVTNDPVDIIIAAGSLELVRGESGDLASKSKAN